MESEPHFYHWAKKRHNFVPPFLTIRIKQNLVNEGYSSSLEICWNQLNRFHEGLALTSSSSYSISWTQDLWDYAPIKPVIHTGEIRLWAFHTRMIRPLFILWCHDLLFRSISSVLAKSACKYMKFSLHPIFQQVVTYKCILTTRCHSISSRHNSVTITLLSLASSHT